MTSEALIDLESLLDPVSEENPAGEDIRADTSPTSLYSSIKDARSAARAAERNAVVDGDTGEADKHWRSILELAPKILQTQAKDLEIASWYTEALIRQYGFQGLRDGFRLIQGLIERYWEELYPLPDEDGIETRVSSLTGLNGEGAEGVLIRPIRNVEITQGNEPGPFSFWRYQQALEVEKAADEEGKAKKASKLGFSVTDIEQAVTESSEAFYLNLRDDINESIEVYREIGKMLDEHCGINDSPPSSNIINILQDCLGAVNHVAKTKLPTPAVEVDESMSDSEDVQDQGGDTSMGRAQKHSGAIKSRQEAFKQLKDISDFFRQTEPHSPISYIIERAVKWGDMPLERLIKELIPDPSARNVFGSLTGIKTEDEQN